MAQGFDTVFYLVFFCHCIGEYFFLRFIWEGKIAYFMQQKKNYVQALKKLMISFIKECFSSLYIYLLNKKATTIICCVQGVEFLFFFNKAN